MAFVALFLADRGARLHFAVFFEIELAVSYDGNGRIDGNRNVRARLVERIGDRDVRPRRFHVRINGQNLPVEIVRLEQFRFLELLVNFPQLALLFFDEIFDVLFELLDGRGNGAAVFFHLLGEPGGDGGNVPAFRARQGKYGGCLPVSFRIQKQAVGAFQIISDR